MFTGRDVDEVIEFKGQGLSIRAYPPVDGLRPGDDQAVSGGAGEPASVWSAGSERSSRLGNLISWIRVPPLLTLRLKTSTWNQHKFAAGDFGATDDSAAKQMRFRSRRKEVGKFYLPDRLSYAGDCGFTGHLLCLDNGIRA